LETGLSEKSLINYMKYLIQINKGMTYRNYVLSNFLSTILTNSDVVVSTTFRNKWLSKHNHQRLKIVKHPIDIRGMKLSILGAKILKLKFWVENSDHIGNLRWRSYAHSYPLKYFLFRFILWVYKTFEHSRLGKKLINDFLFYKAKDIIEKYKPNHVIAFSNDDPVDIIYLYTAFRMGIKTTLFVHSWDNITTKGSIPFRPNNVIVWSDTMADDFRKYHSYLSTNIISISPPQYAYYRRLSKHVSKRDIWALEHINNIDDYKIVTYCTTNPKTFPDEPEFVRFLVEEVKKINKIFEVKVILLIRSMANNFSPIYQDMSAKESFVYFDLIGDLSTLDVVNIDDKFDEDEIVNYVASLKYSNVVINLGSTLTIDAAFFDTPIINIGFNISRLHSEEKRSLFWYSSEHFSRLMSLDAFYLPTSKSEFYSSLIDSIFDSKRHHQGRKRLIDLCLHKDNYDKGDFLSLLNA